MILASEDIGNADPRGLTVATSALQAVEVVGMPEARIILAQATTYLATAPKSNASYLAIEKASADIEHGRVLQVPERLKNVKLKAAGRARTPEGDEQYRYPHDYAGHVVEQEYIPTQNRYYQPSDQGYEDVIRRRMLRWKRLEDDT
jgi:putative ATPase